MSWGTRHVAVALAGLTSLGSQACTPQGALAGDPPMDGPAAAREQALSTGSETRSDAVAAVYPLTPAPLTWAELHKLTANDSADFDHFGQGVALHTDAALVGVYGDDDAGSTAGAAYIYLRSASSLDQPQKLIASDGAAGDLFGESVALSADTAIVGARGDDDAGSYSGSAYVFVRNANAWSEQQKLTASDASTLDDFGRPAALDIDTALIGAARNDKAAMNAGAAYVFTRNADGWTEQQQLIASDAADGDHLGGSVALDANTAVVGAINSDGAGSDGGAAYVFTRNADGWTEQQRLTASDAAPHDHFGISVAVSGNTAIVGADQDGDAGSIAGAAYLFTRSAELWSEQQKLTASDSAAGDRFGSSVALDAGTAIIAAHQDDDAGSDSGSAYVFTRNANAWSEQQKFSASDGGANDHFATSLAISGNATLVGADDDDDGGSNAGSAYLLTLRLVNGEPCANDGQCASTACADGFCCDGPCAESCETCDVAALEGVCTLTPRGESPTGGCGGHLCNGDLNSCPNACGGDADCTPDHHCQDAVVCLPRALDGQACVGGSSCLSGHCVDGICCNQTCAEGCGTCAQAGSEGICTPVETDHPGTPSCTPYLCTGTETACPSDCDEHRDCSLGHHCANGVCQENAQQGAACTADEACTTSHCTDGICCVSDTCGAYRCGTVGACEAACSSSAQCASGHQCNSGGTCDPLPDASGATDENGTCHITGVPAPSRGSARWLGALGLLACLGATRRRRSTRRHGR